MILNYEKLQEYVDQGYVRKQNSVINEQQYEIYCYTQKTFYEGKWDDYTIHARGVIFNVTEKGKEYQINTPMPKIFNAGEHNVTEEKINIALTQDDVEVAMKVNGHLLMVSYDWKNNILVAHTKGSMDSPLVQKDLELLEAWQNEWFWKNVYDYFRTLNDAHGTSTTLMFEVLADYDPHLLLDEQKTILNGGLSEDCVVLLGIRLWDRTGGKIIDLLPLAMRRVAQSIGVPYTNEIHLRGSRKNFRALKSQTNVEGYVIHSRSLEFKAKIKTDWYIRNRYKFYLTKDQVYAMLLKAKTEEELYSFVDEELYPLIKALLSDYNWYVTLESIKAMAILCPDNLNFFEHVTKKEIALSTEIQESVKPYLFDSKNQKWRSNLKYQTLKKDFIERGDNKVYTRGFERKLKEFKGEN